jgi:hypothetical protein
MLHKDRPLLVYDLVEFLHKCEGPPFLNKISAKTEDGTLCIRFLKMRSAW